MSELSALAGSEGYEACPDEADAFRRGIGAVAGGAGKMKSEKAKGCGPGTFSFPGPLGLFLYIFLIDQNIGQNSFFLQGLPKRGIGNYIFHVS